MLGKMWNNVCWHSPGGLKNKSVFYNVNEINLKSCSTLTCWLLVFTTAMWQCTTFRCPTTDLVIWSCEDLLCNVDSTAFLKSSKSMTHEVVFHKYISAEEHDQAKLHLFGNEWEAQGVGVAGAISREWLEIVKSSILSLWWWDGMMGWAPVDKSAPFLHLMVVCWRWSGLRTTTTATSTSTRFRGTDVFPTGHLSRCWWSSSSLRSLWWW